MYTPTICIITAAKKVDVNRVWEAMGRGPDNFSVPAFLGREPVPGTDEPTHYFFHDAGATEDDVATWRGLQQGILPAVACPNGYNWGAEYDPGMFVIDAASAVAATSGEVMQVYQVSGELSTEDFVNGVLAGRNLYRYPGY